MYIYEKKKLMTREEYRKTEYYKQCKLLVSDFINTVFEGDVNQLKTFCMDDLNNLKKYGKEYDKYRGTSMDPDDMAITRAAYCLVWGYIFELKADNIGS